MLDLTKQERAVLISFVFIILSGTTLRYISKTDFPLKDAFHIIDSEKFYHKIDINRATYKDFLDLPYIGPVTAQCIIDYRDEYGPFKSLSEISTIKGVGKNNFSRIEKFLKISFKERQP